MLVEARSDAARVNSAPWISETTFFGETLPCRKRTSAPASTATIASNEQGWGSTSSCRRIFFMEES